MGIKIKTRLRIKIGELTENDFHEKLKTTDWVKNELSNYRSAKIYYIKGVIYVTSNGIINNPAKLKSYIDFAKRITDKILK